MQTFSLIRTENIEVFKDKIIIKIPDVIKTTGKNRLQPVLRIPFFKGNLKFCPASALSEYILRTKLIREPGSMLFVSCENPHKSVKPQTLSKWVSKSMAAAGLDTNLFTAHSTRHAATSTAKRCGVNLDTIRKTATWTSNSSTFARFYDRPLGEDRDLFAISILKQT